MSARLELRGLSHTHRGATAPTIVDLDLTVEPGELVALLGPSGCGKTTTLRVVAGLLHPDAGDVLVDGDSVLGVRPERRGIAMVFQDARLFPHMDVEANVGFGLRMRGVPREEVRARVARHLELVRLPDVGQRAVGQLSGGQQQRVSLARALVVEPRLLLLDEPLSSLDTNLRLEMRELVRDVQHETGVTTVFVTHDQEEAVVLADRIALMLDGRIHQVGRPSDLHRRPTSVAVARFFGTRNVLPGELTEAGFDCGLGVLDVVSEAPRGPGTLLVRPEAIGIGAGPNQLRGRVRRTLYLGAAVRVWLDVDGTELVLTTGPSTTVAEGDELVVHVAPEDAWVVGAR